MPGTLPDPGRIMLSRLAALLFVLINTAHAQSPAEFTLTATSLQNNRVVELDKLPWKYRPDDGPADDDLAWPNPQYASPQFDDRAWETLNGTAITLDRIPK